MLRRLRRAFINPFNVILLALGMISLATDVIFASDFARNATTAIIIFSMILISGVIRLIQEIRAKNAAKQLNRLIHESIRVKRDGRIREIPAEDLVVGDIVLLSAGDRVPADLRLIKVSDLFLSQAAITGESAISEKTCQKLRYSSSETLTQLENLAFMATTVISGKGEGIVLAVGKDTLYGSFAKEDSDEKTGFPKRCEFHCLGYVAFYCSSDSACIYPLKYHRGEMAGILCIFIISSSRVNAGDASDGDHSLSCKRQPEHEPEADNH